MSIKTSGIADNLPVSEHDLLDMQKNFTIQERANFGRVLRDTAELSKGSQFASADQAFEKALDKNGYLEKYKKGCQK